jgi:hypothetical protein
MAQTRTRRRGTSGTSKRSNRNSSSRPSSARRAATRRPRGSSRSNRSSNARSSRRPRTSNAQRSSAARSRSTSRRSTNGVTGTITGVGSSIGSVVEKVGDSVGTVAQRAKMPALMGTAAAAGLAGGVALRSRMHPRSKVAGVPMPRNNGTLRSVAHEMQSVGKEIGKAGFRLGIGDVNVEVQRGRKEHRDSPLEVLLHGLTSRRSKPTK